MTIEILKYNMIICILKENKWNFSMVYGIHQWNMKAQQFNVFCECYQYIKNN